jgi:hypothetical protein
VPVPRHIDAESDSISMIKTPPRSYSYATLRPVYHKGRRSVNLTKGQRTCRRPDALPFDSNVLFVLRTNMPVCFSYRVKSRTKTLTNRA